MSWFRRKAVSPAEIAKQLHSILACEEDPLLAASNFDVPAPCLEAYRQRVFLYREASILLALVERGPGNQKIAPTLKAYEAIIFGKDHAASVNNGRQKAVTEAMKEFADLVERVVDEHYDDPPLATDNEGIRRAMRSFLGIGWARLWFSAIGYDEMNAVTLAEFVIPWMSIFLSARQSVGQLLLNEPDLS